MTKNSNWGNEFIKLSNSKGFQIKNPTKNQFKRFINFFLIGQEKGSCKQVSLCLKTLKPKQKSQWVWVELKNKHGDPGWLFGDADFIVFELVDSYLFVPRKNLIDYVYKNIDFSAPISSSSWDSKYKIFQRNGFLDQITQLKVSKIKELENTYSWNK